MRTLPPVVAGYVEAVADRIAAVLGDELVGVYTTGSLALGGFDPARSDIDLIGVVAGPVDQTASAQRHELARRLDHRRLPCPAAGLEFVLYPEAVVRVPTADAGYLLNLNTGARLAPLASYDSIGVKEFWYPIDRAVARQSGRAVRGAPPRDVFAALPAHTLLPVVIASVEGQSRSQAGDLSDNAVLNGCRALCYATDHRWYPKLEAARRSLAATGRHTAVVRAAVASYRSGRREAATLPPGAVTEFLDHVVGRLQAAARVASYAPMDLSAVTVPGPG